MPKYVCVAAHVSIEELENRAPYGIHLVFLPPYSPELQRGFRLWPLSGAGYRQSSLRDAG